MESPQSSEFKVDLSNDNEADSGDELRQTFILPFVVSTFLILPSLLVIAYTKQTAGFDYLAVNGVYTVIITIIAVLISISAVSSLLYLWRGYSHAAKAGVAILEVVVLAGFIYIIWPK